MRVCATAKRPDGEGHLRGVAVGPNCGEVLDAAIKSIAGLAAWLHHVSLPTIQIGDLELRKIVRR
jgi:hypothetical protein